jgi:hypothetical protein
VIEHVARLSGESLRPVRFRFPRADKREILRALRVRKPLRRHALLFRDLEREIGRHRIFNDQRPEKGADLAARQRLEVLQDQFRRLAEGLAPDTLGREARSQLEIVIQLAMPPLAKRLLARMPAQSREWDQDRYVQALSDSLIRVSELIGIALQGAQDRAKSGRPSDQFRDQFVFDTMRACKTRLGKLPASSRGGPLETLLARCLLYAGYTPANVHELILRGRKTVAL